jgi:hypothetical protein
MSPSQAQLVQVSLFKPTDGDTQKTVRFEKLYYFLKRKFIKTL